MSFRTTVMFETTSSRHLGATARGIPTRRSERPEKKSGGVA